MNPWNFLFPFQKHIKNFTSPSNVKDMESYMNQMLSNMQNNGFGDGKTPFSFDLKNSSTSNPNIFETHHDIFVRLPVSDPQVLKNLKIFHTSNTLIVEGLSQSEKQQTFTLPAIVKKKGASASFKDDTLEIRLEKAKDLQFSEINITEIK